MNVLTAEQVRVAIFNGSSYASYDGAKYYADGISMQAIADELNSRAERTCKRVLYKPTGVLVCSECGAGMPKQLEKYCYLHYCPNCGAKVVEE